MKVKAIDPADKDITFPCLLTNDRGVIILATEELRGFKLRGIVVSNFRGNCETTQDEFFEDEFEYYHGKVVLSND